MQLKQEEAATIARFLLANYEGEMATTRRVIAAVPEGQPEYAPGPKYMTALKLALHLPTADDLFLRGLLEGKFSEDKEVAQQVKSIADVLAWFDAKLPPLVERLKSAPPETWTRELDFFGVFKPTGLQVMALTLKHSIHHRGQLSVYLRPMGGKVPGIYGPSGDDK